MMKGLHCSESKRERENFGFAAVIKGKTRHQFYDLDCGQYRVSPNQIRDTGEKGTLGNVVYGGTIYSIYTFT